MPAGLERPAELGRGMRDLGTRAHDQEIDILRRGEDRLDRGIAFPLRSPSRQDQRRALDDGAVYAEEVGAVSVNLLGRAEIDLGDAHDLSPSQCQTGRAASPAAPIRP
jgi:hypothetical protein